MKDVYCCGCELNHFFECKNCGEFNGHYIKNWLKHENEYYICSICKIETKIPEAHKIKQIKLL